MTATALLFRDDAYLRTCDATVVGVTPEGGVILDRTICYAQGGGQPGDVATIERADGRRIAVTNTVYATDRTQVAHLVGADNAAMFSPGEKVSAAPGLGAPLPAHARPHGASSAERGSALSGDRWRDCGW